MVLVETFESRGQARRGRTYLALGLGMAALYYALKHDMDPIVPTLAGVYVALVVVRLILNPTRGFRLGENRLTWYAGLRRYSLSYDDLDTVSIGRNPNGKTLCVVTTRDGQTLSLPGVERSDPGKLMREFGLHGVPIMGLSPRPMAV